VRRVALLAAAAVACAVAASPAAATNECNGLMICVPVAGPWVVAGPGQVEYQLSCPKNYIVAGLDAELQSRRIEVGFAGAMGSPVNPGISTAREVVFLGRVLKAGGGGGVTFKPHIGCVPASGGGRRTPTAYHAFPPQKLIARRVVNFTVAGTTTRTAHCANREVLVTATHAIGFRGERPPDLETVATVSVRQSVRNGSVKLTVRAPRRSGAVAQLNLLCAPR
jgi:hypothetical protein